jgi:hypothetical protein
MAFRAEQGDDLVLGREKSLGLAGGHEPIHDLFSSSRMAIRGFDLNRAGNSIGCFV